MNVPTRGDISVFVTWCDLTVGLKAENASWAPDIATDMVSRIKTLWADSLAEAWRYGLLEYASVDEDELVGEEMDGGEDG